MPLDTSSYYPDPLLPPEEKNDSEVIIKDVNQPPISESVDVPEISSPASEEIEMENNESDEKRWSKDSSPDSFLDKLATAISWVLVPMMMPVYGMILIFNLSILSFNPLVNKVVITLIVAGLNVLLPALIVMLLHKLGVISDIGLNNRTERTIPYIVVGLCLGATAFFMYYKGAPQWVVAFFTGGMATAIINLVVNRWWKISAHAAGIAGIVAVLLRISAEGYPQGNITAWILVVIFLAGLMGSARVWLGRHTVMQVLAGYLVGFLGVYFL